jgi:hypothetical protein
MSCQNIRTTIKAQIAPLIKLMRTSDPLIIFFPC